MKRIALIIDGDAARCRSVAATLLASGWRVETITSVTDLAHEASRLHPAAVVVVLGAADVDRAAAAVARFHAERHDLRLLLLSVDCSDSTLSRVRQACPDDDVLGEPDGALMARTVIRWLESTRVSAPAAADDGFRGGPALVGHTQSIVRIQQYLTKVAQTDSTVLITGDTGTGKELVAALIHARSARRTNRFVPINCAAIPETLLESELFGYDSGAFTGAARAREGLLQLANNGTVFLDEIGEMSPQGQVKILRVIETREVFRLGSKHPVKLDIRIVAATNQDPEQAVEDGRLRKDLYFRLNVARVHLPRLSERRSDIVPLLDHYLCAFSHRAAHVPMFAAEALAALTAYDWPGNVRELKNLVEAVLVSPPSGRVSIGDLPEHFQRKLAGVCRLPDDERRRLLEALVAAKWNKSKAAELLNWSRMTVYRKMARYSVIRSDGVESNRKNASAAAGRRAS